MLRLFVLAASLHAQAPETPTGYLGSLTPILRSMHAESNFRMDYFHRGTMSLETWRRRGRTEVARRLAYAPKPVPLDLKVHETRQRDGYQTRVISFAGSPHYRIPGLLLVPNGTGPFPALVAIHDHGGYFYHGKEKLVAMENEHAALTKFKADAYGGRSYADELAKRGFVVLAIDAFYWGERRMKHDVPPPELEKAIRGLSPDSLEYVRAMNTWLGARRHDLNSNLSLVGATWLGIMNHDDRRGVDLLASLREVDPKRIGCLGLSIGGMRSTYLVGTDPRIRAAIITGWMTSMPTHLGIPYSVVAGLPDVPGLHANLDHPDVATLAAPAAAIFVQNCARDQLFTRAGMEGAAEKIRRVYADTKHPERFQAKFYDAPHQFNVAMQEEAFEWLERWLRER